MWGDRQWRGFVIFGVAGVGKSRLAEEWLDRAVGAGFKGARATASAAAAAVPLGAIAHLLPTGVDLSDPVRGFATVVEVLGGAARRERWAVLVDDLHLLDATSAVLLRQLMDAGVVRLIGTVRTGEPASEAVQALVTGEAVYRVDLAELDHEQVEAVLQKVLGGLVGRRTIRELFMASGGNVLYLRELVRGALTAGTLAKDAEMWELAEGRASGTARLSDLIKARLASVGLQARPVLDLLSLCQPLSLADAETIASPDVLSELDGAGLIRAIQDSRRTTISLAHPLYGETLRAEIPILSRRIILLAQAERTEAHGARRRDDALHIATWRLAATGTADPTLLAQAATLARHAHDYQQVVTLLQALPTESHSANTMLLLGEAFLELGDSQRAEEALAAADLHVNSEQEKIAVTLARTTNLFWIAARVEEALSVNDRARSVVTSTAGRRLLRINEATLITVSGQPARGLDLLEDLEEELQEASDVTAWLMGAVTKATGLAMTGKTLAAIKAAEKAYRAHVQANERALMPNPSMQLVVATIATAEAGDLRKSTEIGESVYTDLMVAGATFPQVWSAFHLGRTEWLAGHATSARRWYAEAVALARARHYISALHPALGGLAAATALLGETHTCEAALKERNTYRAMGAFSGEEYLAESWLLAARGHLSQAREILLKAARIAQVTGHVTSESALLTDVARLGGAKEVADRLRELAQVCDGAFAAARAHFATALAYDNPEQLLGVAEEMESIGADLLSAEAASTAAAVWRRRGQTRLATDADRKAAAAAARCEGARTPLLATTVTASLTPREREIAFLASNGNSSKDIAIALTLSVRTVNNHLHHIYNKLGVTTRRELAQILR
ncbi:LuxR C-terminal-related transcriptional regulator [Streptomyces sp. NPDC085614]|uniref:helix-turn-helix transcriptional regulator n=1 Tax=Streptomyces sp. NPDC085614 TaxID=3365733 RepID=UPI0037D0B037